MSESFQTIGLLFIAGVVIFGVFFLLSLAGGITNTKYKIRGVGTVQPTTISKETVEQNINIAKSSFKKIGLSRYEKILVDIQIFLKKENSISIQFARKYVYYGNILFYGIKTFSSPTKENLEKAFALAKENNDESLFKSFFTSVSVYESILKIENLERKIKYRKFDEISLKLGQILNESPSLIENKIYSISVENSFYIEDISNKIIAFYWKNKLSKEDCQKLIDYIYLNYSSN